MTVTAQTIITDALQEIGAIGTSDTVYADDAQPALRRLNRMLDAWALQNLFAYHVGWQVFNLPAGTEAYTIGPSGSVNVARPVRIEIGGFTRVSGVDQPFELVSRDKYAEVSIKDLDSNFPIYVYYEAASPIATLHFWPQAACEVHLPIQTRLSAFADLTTPYTLPPGYEDAIFLSLAERLCLSNARPMPDGLSRAALNARNAIKKANFQVPELQIGEPQLYGMGAFLAG